MPSTGSKPTSLLLWSDALLTELLGTPYEPDRARDEEKEEYERQHGRGKEICAKKGGGGGGGAREMRGRERERERERSQRKKGRDGEEISSVFIICENFL